MPRKPLTQSIWRTVKRDPWGNVESDSGYVPNLRTTTGIDWQGPLMGGGPASSTYATGTAASDTATTVTLPTSGAPGSTSAFNGQVISMGGAWGIIISNTNASPPVLTIDLWHSPTNPANTATTPTAGVYNIIQGQAPIQYIALTADATAAAAGDTTLATELTTNGFSRAFATYSHTGGTASFSLAKTFSCTGGSTTINKEGNFLGQNGAGGGDVMAFESVIASAPTLISGDTVQVTCTISY